MIWGAISLACAWRVHYNSGLTGAGWSSLAARRAHNPKVVGSNPTPATNLVLILVGFKLLLPVEFPDNQSRSLVVHASLPRGRGTYRSVPSKLQTLCTGSARVGDLLRVMGISAFAPTTRQIRLNSAKGTHARSSGHGLAWLLKQSGQIGPYVGIHHLYIAFGVRMPVRIAAGIR